MSLKLPSGEYTTHDKTWEQVAEDANVTASQIVRDCSRITNEYSRRRGAGGVRGDGRARGRAGRADDWWDVEPDDPDAVNEALDRIGSEEWQTRYNARYAMHADYRGHVGRLWGLNTLGDWTDYWRRTGEGEEAEE